MINIFEKIELVVDNKKIRDLIEKIKKDESLYFKYEDDFRVRVGRTNCSNMNINIIEKISKVFGEFINKKTSYIVKEELILHFYSNL